MQPLKARQWCKALQRRKQESRKMKALETVQIEEQLLHKITFLSSKAFPTAYRAFPCTPSPSSVKMMKPNSETNLYHTATQSFHNWPTTCLHFLISHPKRITKHPCQCQYQSQEEMKELPRSWWQEQVWDEWYQGQTEFKQSGKFYNKHDNERSQDEKSNQGSKMTCRRTIRNN